MSELKTNKISPVEGNTVLTLGDSGDTINIPAGATIVNSGTATGFGSTNASDLTSGTLPDARFPATLPAISGANLTNLPASGLTSYAGVFTRNTALSDGQVSYTGLGFQPTAILVQAADYTSVGKASWGFGDSAKRGRSINDYSRVSPNTWNPMTDLLAILEEHPKKTRVTIVSYDVDGFTLSYYTGNSGPTGTFTCNYLALK